MKLQTHTVSILAAVFSALSTLIGFGIVATYNNFSVTFFSILLFCLALLCLYTAKTGFLIATYRLPADGIEKAAGRAALIQAIVFGTTALILACGLVKPNLAEYLGCAQAICTMLSYISFSEYQCRMQSTRKMKEIMQTIQNTL
jgi:hypothetical protein